MLILIRKRGKPCLSQQRSGTEKQLTLVKSCSATSNLIIQRSCLLQPKRATSWSKAKQNITTRSKDMIMSKVSAFILFQNILAIVVGMMSRKTLQLEGKIWSCQKCQLSGKHFTKEGEQRNLGIRFTISRNTKLLWLMLQSILTAVVNASSRHAATPRE